MTLRIVTDSTCDLPREAIQSLGITVVPLSILFGDEQLLDGVDIQSEQFFRRLERDPNMPTTAQPSPALFTRAYERLIEEGATEILSIHLSQKLSGTLESARQGAQGVEGARIEQVDSATLSLGLGIGVMEAAKAARAGAGLDHVRALVTDIFRRTHIFVTLDTLEYLRRGGRMSRGQELLGTLLKVKPVLSIQDGEVVPVGRVRTRQRAIEDIISRCTALRPVEHLFVIHSTTPDEANYMRDRIAALDSGAAITVGRITPVIGVHGGPGVLGVGVVTAPDEQSRTISAR
ncbi:MAG: DegV family protein [Dehalococcoidia bacterium]|nr:DegV family protein [Dehalococcoidia bacterium]